MGKHKSKSYICEGQMVILGASTVGKSLLCHMNLLNPKPSPIIGATIGAEFFHFSVEVAENKMVNLQIWDTAGGEEFHHLLRMYYRTAKAALLVYDITNRESFETVKTWVQDLRVSVPSDFIIFLVGNKADQSEKRRVYRSEVSAYCRDNNLMFVETSAHTGMNCAKPFQAVAMILADRYKKQQLKSRNNCSVS